MRAEITIRPGGDEEGAEVAEFGALGGELEIIGWLGGV